MRPGPVYIVGSLAALAIGIATGIVSSYQRDRKANAEAGAMVAVCQKIHDEIASLRKLCDK
jgi:hypothetical protein